MEINHNGESSEKISSWRNSQIDLVENANRKNGHRIASTALKRSEKIDSLSKITISNFLNGNITLSRLESRFPEDYERFLRVVSHFEIKVEELCLTNDLNNSGLYKSITSELKEKIADILPYIDHITVDRLTEQVLADWILRCPIDFE